MCKALQRDRGVLSNGVDGGDFLVLGHVFVFDVHDVFFRRASWRGGHGLNFFAHDWKRSIIRGFSWTAWYAWWEVQKKCSGHRMFLFPLACHDRHAMEELHGVLQRSIASQRAKVCHRYCCKNARSLLNIELGLKKRPPSIALRGRHAFSQYLLAIRWVDQCVSLRHESWCDKVLHAGRKYTIPPHNLNPHRPSHRRSTDAGISEDLQCFKNERQALWEGIASRRHVVLCKYRALTQLYYISIRQRYESKGPIFFPGSVKFQIPGFCRAPFMANLSSPWTRTRPTLHALRFLLSFLTVSNERSRFASLNVDPTPVSMVHARDVLVPPFLSRANIEKTTAALMTTYLSRPTATWLFLYLMACKVC